MSTNFGYPSKITAKVSCLATGVSAGALTALHLLSPEFDPSWRMVSEYANGDYGWLLRVVFITWALGSFALALALRPFAHGWLGRMGFLFLVLAGIGEAMGGLFDVNHPLHGVAFGLGVPSLLIAAILVTIATRRADLHIPTWTAALPALSVVVMGVSMAMLFSALEAVGITMSSESEPITALPEGVTAWNGYANRAVFAAYYLWVGIAAVAVLRRKT